MFLSMVTGRDVAQAVALAALSLALALAGCSPRSSYPSKPIILICPWSPGGGTDRLSRQLAAQLERELGVPVNVVNATGGGGVTGHTRGALARPDGDTLTMATVELNMLHWRGLTAVSHYDFEPLALLNRDDAAVFVFARPIEENTDGSGVCLIPVKEIPNIPGGVRYVVTVTASRQRRVKQPPPLESRDVHLDNDFLVLRNELLPRPAPEN